MARSRQIVAGLVGGLMAIIAGAAYAAEGAYIGVGGASLLDQDRDATLPQVLELAQPNGVGAFGAVGYHWDSAFSTEIEGGLRARGVEGIARDENGRGAEESTTLLMVNARLSPPVNGPLKPYAGVGAGLVIVSTQDYSLRSDRDEMATAGQALAGFSLDVSSRTSLFAEYRYFKLLDGGKQAGDSGGGRSDSHSGFVGLKVRLGDLAN